jgi:hypothetical protein
MLYALLPGPEDQVFDVEYFLSPESHHVLFLMEEGWRKLKGILLQRYWY